MHFYLTVAGQFSCGLLGIFVCGLWLHLKSVVENFLMIAAGREEACKLVVFSLGFFSIVVRR